jgi:hypothetical protein
VYQAYVRRNPYVESYEIFMYAEFFVQMSPASVCLFIHPFRPNASVSILPSLTLAPHARLTIEEHVQMFKNAKDNYIAHVTAQRSKYIDER